MKILFIIVSFVLSLKLYGQTIDKASQLLKDKDIRPLKEFVEESRKKNFNVDMEIFREVIPGFREGVLKINEQKRGGQKNTIICNVDISFLSTDKTIFYYHFDKSCFNDSAGKLKSLDFLKDSFTNGNDYNKFEKTFFDAYETIIDKTDLFQTSIVYGRGCGIAGMPPEYQEKLDSLIKNNDLTTVRAWLRSPNSEKQLYAIEGLIRLEKKLNYITLNDRKVIDIIRQKKGQVRTCSGCLYSRDEIAEIIPYIDSSFRTHKRTSSELTLAAVYSLIAILLLMFSVKSQLKSTKDFPRK